MATKTTNYQFTKPEEDDFYNIEEANENWDVVDQELKKLEEEKANVSGGDISNTVIHALDSQEEEFPIPAAGDTVRGFSGKVKKFFEDFKAFKDGVITVGRLVNNGLTTKEGFALDARYGKTLADGFDKLNSQMKNFRTYYINALPDTQDITKINAIQEMYKSIPNHTSFIILVSGGNVVQAIGYKANDYYGYFNATSYGRTSGQYFSPGGQVYSLLSGEWEYIGVNNMNIIESGYDYFTNVEDGAKVSKEIVYTKHFPGTPIAIANIIGTDYPAGRFCATNSHSSNGFKIVVSNQTGATVSLGVQWIAVFQN